MASYIDNGFLGAIGNVQFPDYSRNFSQTYGLFEDTPWSYRNKRKAQMEDFQMMMQQQRFQAEMADRARNAQIQEMLLPYQIQRAQRLAQAPAVEYQPNVVGQFQNWFQQPEVVAPSPVIENEIPVLTQPDTTDLNYIPDIPTL